VPQGKWDIADYILGPVMAVLDIPNLCGRWADSQASNKFRAQHPQGESWLGCGAPPWSSPTFDLKLPHFVALVCSWLGCGGEPGGLIAESLCYPKRLRACGFWVELRSELHERLVAGFFFSLTYCLLYVLIVRQDLMQGCSSASNFTECALEAVRNCAALLALLCYLPAMVICLVHIRRIDAVIDILSTIRRLEDINRVVATFDARTRTEEQRKVLLEAVDSRVIRRIDLVDRFRSHVTRRDVPVEQVAEATQSLERCLQDAADALGPAAEWLDLPPETRESLTLEFCQKADGLWRELDDAAPPEPALPDAPEIALRVFEKAARPHVAFYDDVQVEKSRAPLRRALRCVRRCRKRAPAQLPAELLHAKGGVSYVLVFPAVHWLRMSAPAQQQEDGEAALSATVDSLPSASDGEGGGEHGERKELLTPRRAQEIVAGVCPHPAVLEKLGGNGAAYLLRAYRNLLPPSGQRHIQLKWLQQHTLELMLLYLRYCGCKLQVARSTDGDRLLVTVRLREEVAKCHASDLGYVLRMSPHLATLLGAFGAGGGGDAGQPPSGGLGGDAGAVYHPYSGHLEQSFKDRFGPGRLDLLVKSTLAAASQDEEEKITVLEPGDSEGESDLDSNATAPITDHRLPFPALALVVTGHGGGGARPGGRRAAADGFYKARRDNGDPWPEDWRRAGPPLGEVPDYYLVPPPGEEGSQAVIRFEEHTKLWTHRGNDGEVLAVCAGPARGVRSEVPVSGWQHPDSAVEKKDVPVASYFFEAGPYHPYFGATEEGSIFRGVDRVRLINSILREVFDLEIMEKHGLLLNHFMPHQPKSVVFFMEQWANWRHVWHLEQPLEHIRNYFGEKAAFDHAFLGFLTGASLPLGLMSVLCSVMPEWLYPRSVFAVFAIAWASAFQVLWSRRERWLCMEWGMDTMAVSREGAASCAPIAEYSAVSPKRVHSLKNATSPRTLQRLSCAAAPILILILSLTMQGIYGELYKWLLAEGVSQTSRIIAVLMTAQILLFDAMCTTVAQYFTKIEDHTESCEFNDTLIWRMFIFKAIVGYVPFALGGLVLPLTGQRSAECYARLGAELEIVVALRLLVSLLRGTRPAVVRRAKFAFEGLLHSGYEGIDDSSQSPRNLEEQAQMPPYSDIENICEQLEMLIQLGYILCCGLLSPKLGVAFLGVNLLRIRVWARSLLRGIRRPFPEGATGRTVWNRVLCAIIWLSVVSTSALLTIVNSDPSVYGSEGAVIAGKYFLRAYVVTGDDSNPDFVRLLLVLVTMKYTLGLLQAFVRSLFPEERASTVSAQMSRKWLLSQLRDVVSVKEDMCEQQEAKDLAPETIIRDWIAGARPLGADDNDFELRGPDQA